MPLASVAVTYGLLQLPKMPELKNQDVSDFPEVPNLDINQIPYKDKQRETLRLQKLKQYEATGTWPGKQKKAHKKATEAWSKTKQMTEEKKERRRKRKRVKEMKTNAGEPVKKKKKKKGQFYLVLNK